MKIQIFVDKKFFKTLFLLILFPICISASPKQGGTLTVPIITPAFTENFNPFTNGDNIKGLMFEPLNIFFINLILTESQRIFNQYYRMITLV